MKSTNTPAENEAGWLLKPDQTGVVGISGRKPENLIRKRIPDSSGFLGLCFKSWALVWGVGKNPSDFPAFILGTDAQASW